MQKSAPLFNRLSEHIIHNKEILRSVGRSHHFFNDLAHFLISHDLQCGHFVDMAW